MGQPTVLKIQSGAFTSLLVPAAPPIGALVSATESTTVLASAGPAQTAILTPVAAIVPASNGSAAFLIANRFSELDTQDAKTQARQNLDLQSIDCGVFL